MPIFAISRAAAKRIDMSNLSILIPTYNDVCVNLVKDLHRLCMRMEHLDFEIIVADDGSTSQPAITANQEIDNIPHCRYIIRKQNAGRSAIRNFLARSATYDHLLFIDSHMTVVSNDYISRYLRYCDEHPIVYGSYTIPQHVDVQEDNLRWKYEMKCLDAQHVEARSKNPYANFHTSNFLISKSVMLSHPLDERFRRYGYEDVLYGKKLLQCGIPILHINNPIGFCRFESNERFMQKTEEGIQTLYEFRDELVDYSRMLQLSIRLTSYHLRAPICFFFGLLRRAMRKNLTSHHPSLTIFDLYRLGYLLSLTSKQWHNN